jgi:hypothetical protein
MTNTQTGGSSPTFPTPACILRAAAAYVLDHGVHQPVLVGGELSQVDRSTDRLTPAASPEGAIAMVVFGHPTREDGTGSDRDLYTQALAYLRLVELEAPLPPGSVVTVNTAAEVLLWSSLVWEVDHLSCPGCGGPVCGVPPAGRTARVVIPVYRHFPSMRPLCGASTATVLPVYHRWEPGND